MRRALVTALASLAVLGSCASPERAPSSDPHPPAPAVTPRESALQAAVLQEHAAIHEGRPVGEPVLVCRESRPGAPSPERTEAILRRFPDLPRNLLEALNEVNERPVDLSERFDHERVTLVERDWAWSLPVGDFFDGEPGWPALREEYPAATGIWLCSRSVEIDGEALVELYWNTRFGDFQEYVVLETEADGWRVVGNFVTGIE